MSLSGGCLCGQVRYSLRAVPGPSEHCHCAMCRKWHGSAFSTNAELRESDLEWKGGQGELASYRSSPLRERVFCRRCGAKLFIRRLDTPDAIALCLATLEGDPQAQPSRQVMTAFRAPWAALDESLPRFDVYPGFETALRPTREADLDFVMALERDPENTPYIGHWTREQHRAAIAAADREHWLIARAHDGAPLGFLLAFDLRAQGFGVFVKRVAVRDKSRGLGREALGRFLRHAFGELGASHTWLSVRRGNERATRAYRALGFQVAEVTRAERSARAAAAGGFGDDSALMRVERPESGP